HRRRRRRPGVRNQLNPTTVVETGSTDTVFIGCKAAPVACLGSVKASLEAVRSDTRSGVGRFLARRELSFAFMQDSFIFRCGYTALLKGLIPWHRRSRFT